jgi:hypothetical protein
MIEQPFVQDLTTLSNELPLDVVTPHGLGLGKLKITVSFA